jgi:hypothetical protein
MMRSPAPYVTTEYYNQLSLLGKVTRLGQYSSKEG